MEKQIILGFLRWMEEIARDQAEGKLDKDLEAVIFKYEDIDDDETYLKAESDLVDYYITKVLNK